MNSRNWLGGAVAPIGVALGAGRYGMSFCIRATAAICLSLDYLLLRISLR